MDRGAVLGEFPEWRYEQNTVQLHSGDTLVLFTDGITEIRNSEGVEFGEERLIQLLRDNKGLPASVIQKSILAEVLEYGNGNFFDDATLIVLSVD
jgi:sigma-B regulation protein RsbU (phosphoserine phosphatase)